MTTTSTPAVSTRNTGSTANDFSVSIGTTAWELDLFGRVRSLNRNALDTYFATAETQSSTHLSLVAQVAAQYLTLREQEEQLALAQQTLLAVQKSYDLNKKQFELGVASELDFSTTDAQVQTARINVIGSSRVPGMRSFPQVPPVIRLGGTLYITPVVYLFMDRIQRTLTRRSRSTTPTPEPALDHA